MFSYLATMLGTALAAGLAGWRLGRRRNCRAALSLPTVVVLTGLGLAWLIGAQWARGYADTDGFGTEAAGWFAHAGKWLVLLGAMMFGHGWIGGAQQIPAGRLRRLFYYTAVLGAVALVGARTMPVYVLLGDGRRDADGFLRESQTLEATCGAVALLNYLEQFRQHSPLTEREVARVCGVTPEGTTTAALVRAARQFGLTNATARVLTLAELEKSRLPAIVSISTLSAVHHATLLVRLDEQSASFIDPAYGAWKTSRERFQQIWYGQTVLLE